MSDWPTFTCSYRFNDAEWGVTIKAPSFEDARRRIRAIGLTGKVDGELVAIIPAGIPVAGLGVRLACWLTNFGSIVRRRFQ